MQGFEGAALRPAQRVGAWLLLGFSCSLQCAAVLLLKATNVYVGGAFLQRATSPLFAAAIGLMAMQLFVWRGVLQRLPISVAYPVTAIVVPLNLAGGTLLFGERLSPVQIGAGLLVAAGVAVLTRAEATTAEKAIAPNAPLAPRDSPPPSGGAPP